jgi:RNase adaptor protein for sRNA GlmZ degradation
LPDRLPDEAAWVVDTRFLDSPYWIGEMRKLPGTGTSRYLAKPPLHLPPELD